MEKGQCRSCRKPILWVKMALSQRMMPLDAEPLAVKDGEKPPRGSVAIKDGLGVSVTGELFDDVVEGPFYRSHFASCPFAGSHRK